MRRSFNNLSQIFNLKATDIFSSPIIKKGIEYYTNGYVTGLKYLDSEHIAATVIGTKKYNVSMAVESGVLKMNCSCPCDGDCKHMVATYLYAKNKKEEEESKLNIISHYSPEVYYRSFHSDLIKKLGNYMNVNYNNINGVAITINKYRDKLMQAIENAPTQEAIQCFINGTKIISSMSINYSTPSFEAVVDNYYNVASILLEKDFESFFSELNILVSNNILNSVNEILMQISVTEQLSSDAIKALRDFINYFEPIFKVKGKRQLYRQEKYIFLREEILRGLGETNDASRLLLENAKIKAIRDYALSLFMSRNEYDNVLALYDINDKDLSYAEYKMFLTAAKNMNHSKKTEEIVKILITNIPSYNRYADIKAILEEKINDVINIIIDAIKSKGTFEDYLALCRDNSIEVPKFVIASHKGFSEVRKNYKQYIKDNDYELMELYINEIKHSFNSMFHNFSPNRGMRQYLSDLLDEIGDIPNSVHILNAFLIEHENYRYYRETVAYQMIKKKIAELQ